MVAKEWLKSVGGIVLFFVLLNAYSRWYEGTLHECSTLITPYEEACERLDRYATAQHWVLQRASKNAIDALNHSSMSK
jgi:hypothetical protein